MHEGLRSLRDEPIAFAHRGARAHARENTLEAFALALRLGASGLETDAWLTSDGVVVLDHDGVVRRRIRKTPIGSCRRADLPAHVPALVDLFGRLGTDYELSIDVKDPAAFEAIAETVRASPMDPSRVWLCHPDHRVLVARRTSLREFRLVESTRLKKIPGGLERRVALLADAGVDAVNMHHTDWTGGHVAMVHRFGVHALAWDVQYPEKLVSVLSMGVDGIFSDHVDRMVAAYSEVVGHVPRR